MLFFRLPMPLPKDREKKPVRDAKRGIPISPVDFFRLPVGSEKCALPMPTVRARSKRGTVPPCVARLDPEADLRRALALLVDDTGATVRQWSRVGLKIDAKPGVEKLAGDMWGTNGGLRCSRRRLVDELESVGVESGELLLRLWRGIEVAPPPRK